ncbi:MAG: DUF188 domain-containing protein [bacterium]
MPGETEIYVDADACPVVEDVLELADNYRVHLVCNRHHELNVEGDNVQIHRSTDRQDGADHYIYNHSSPGDIVVTDDLGLAALALGGRREVIRFRGDRPDNDDIHWRLQLRHAAGQARRAGKKTSGPSKFTESDHDKFRKSFKKLLK